jgi:hypothetical protein
MRRKFFQNISCAKLKQYKEDGIMKKSLIYLTFLIGVLLFFANSSVAQTSLPNDTMWIENKTVNRGDVIWLTLGTKNDSVLSAFTARFTYNTSVLTPFTFPDTTVDTSTVPWDTSVIQRAVFDTLDPAVRTNSWQGNTLKSIEIIVGNPSSGVMTALGLGIWYFDTLAVGSGPILKIKFTVNATAPIGPSTVAFQDDPEAPTGTSNVWSDKYGTTDFRPILRNGTITVSGTPINEPPVFASLPDSFRVTQLELLTFSVSATDPEGDSVTIWAEGGPSGYTFAQKSGLGSVNQTFNFTPALSQSGAYIVTFKAKDRQGKESSKNVRIVIVALPQDILQASTKEGGVPGTTGIPVPIWFVNLDDVYGIQFTMKWDSTVFRIDSFTPTGRIAGFNLHSNLGDHPGEVTVLIFGMNNEIIPAGSDTILYVNVSVLDSAAFGTFPIEILNAKEAISIDPDIPAKNITSVNGSFTVDRWGDLNLSGAVDISDIVSLIAYLLGNISLNTRQLNAADANRDAGVNIGDLVAVINIIFGRPITTPPASPMGPLATVKLDKTSLIPGQSGEVSVLADLQIPVAGVQLEFSYSPNEVTFSPPALTERSQDFTIRYKDDGKGKLIVLLFNLSGKTINTGSGTILNLPAEVNSSVQKPEQLNLSISEVYMADKGAALISVENASALPKAFQLKQNYPNPFNPNTTIEFIIPAEAPVHTTLKVYNLLGQEVKLLIDEVKTPGNHQVIWDGTNSFGEKVSSGIYLYRMVAENFKDTKKMVLLK